MLSEADIRAALRDCYDPALPCNIVDLGMVRTILVVPDPDAPGSGIPGVPQKVRITVAVTATTPTDDADAHLSAQIRNRLAGLEAVSHTDVLFEEQPAWSPNDISPTGRRTLGLDGNRNLVQIR
jgi:metal-sulfur cluster biosynthetic enzyme